ncbi:hypothetical protein MASR1M107_05020 [Ignavibacteriales bacterium]
MLNALCKTMSRAFLVTAPISKYAFSLAGVDFPGHTELLAEWENSSDFVMSFLSNQLKCALATIHIPLVHGHLSSYTCDKPRKVFNYS